MNNEADRAIKRKRWIVGGVIVTSAPILIVFLGGLEMLFLGDTKMKDEGLAVLHGVGWSLIYWFVFWARWRGNK